ncbi:MAG TPA: GNAT family N-acetyltransferase [Vicinamibacteria bacterium]|nr:GNAT family N-acetyltransferase [Vicinamibacteria bacterium]
MTAAVRAAAPEEADALAALINAAFAVERFFIDGDRTSAAEVRALMGKGAFLVSEAQGALSGCVYVERRGARGYFGLLAVDPARKGTGLGRALVAAAEDRFRGQGCEAADISVVDLRQELPPFYRRLGYVETGTAPFPSDGKATRPCHFILMSKPLAPSS